MKAELKKIIITELINSFGNGNTADTYFDTVAGNILDKLPEQIMASGKVTKDIPDLDIYFINGRQVNSLFKKFEGKKIEIAVREVK